MKEPTTDSCKGHELGTTKSVSKIDAKFKTNTYTSIVIV